ncbi:MAG: nuclear transport factor 2 family protein [Bacteroidales bacterium]|jgi:hypothetical protein
MKKRFLLSTLLIAFTLGTFSQNNEDIANDREMIKEVIQSAYVEGLQNEGDIAKIDAGFHPGFRLLGTGPGGEMWELPISEWKERVVKEVAEGKKPRKAEEAVSVKFLEVDVTGNAAMAKFEFYVGEKLTFIDYLFLYKFENQWMIVSKIFYKLPETL